MEKIYLFGAGINCYGAIKFFGKENIIAIIDNDPKKQGDTIENVSIIGLEEYLAMERNELIVISSYYKGDEIEQQLRAKGVVNVYRCPYMQMGFYEGIDQLISEITLSKYSEIYMYMNDPFTQLISERVDNHITIIKSADKILLKEKDVILITNDIQKEEIKKYNFEDKQICDINKIYKGKFVLGDSRLCKFKNIHNGKRCFIIGNGPSLKYSDLELLYQNNEICFGVNRIYQAYEHTKWRPNYYVAVDSIIIQKDYNIILEQKGVKFIRHLYNADFKWKNNLVYEFQGFNCLPGKPRFSTQIEKGIYCGNTVIYEALQIAAYMGFKEIYLLGVDMTTGKNPNEEGFHFYKTVDKNEKLLEGNFVEVFKAFDYAKKVMENNGIVIRNATRGGKLECFERVLFDTLF